jgi:peptide/nickel transport system substrate-binding protein
MEQPLHSTPRPIKWRALLGSLGASALLIGTALNPATLAAATPGDAPAAVPHSAQLRDVARKDPLMVSGFGPGLSEIQDPQNMNPYSLGGTGRVRGILNKTIFEFLYLYNHNTGEEIPWLAESYTQAADAQSIAVTLRNGVEWSDGQPFTSDDVKFTIEMLRDSPALVFAADIKEWVRDVTVTDARNFTINLNKPNVRFFYFYFIENSEIHLPILPRHIWQGQDPATFVNYDLATRSPVGTGPYYLVDASGQAQIFDRNDNWWAAKVGFQNLPKPLRVVFMNPGAADTAAARMINNEFDAGAVMQPGVFEASRARNPNIVSWNTTGPSWGAPDACMYTLGLNTRWGPTADVRVRRAIQNTINRQRMVDLAYESSTVPLVVPFSTLGGLAAYQSQFQWIIDTYKPGDTNVLAAAADMQEAGYVKDSAGYWSKDGTRLSMELPTPGWLKPMAPVLEKQLRDGGFDTTFKLYDPDSQPFFDLVRAGKASIWIIVHCGSSREPHGTLQHFHSRFASPSQGEQNQYIWANSQYINPEYDAIINQMDVIQPSPTDLKYVDLAGQATNIFLRDVLEITLAEERHVTTFNNTYWTGWMNASNPYAAPYSLWAPFLMSFLKLEPGPGQ